jgi:hypothetical protein
LRAQAPRRLAESAKLPAPLFTPATKAEEGHDENISEALMAEIVGEDVTRRLRDISLALYGEAEAYARARGIIIADTQVRVRPRRGRARPPHRRGAHARLLALLAGGKLRARRGASLF